MRILVTGATGLIGTRVCRELVSRKHELAIVSRDPERAALKLKLPAMEFKWDALTDSFPPLALDRVEAIVHLAGEPVADRVWTATERERILKSRAQGSNALAEALSELPVALRPKVLVTASATGFYGNRPGDDWLNEGSPRGSGFLSDVCVAWEKATGAAGAHCGRYAALRIGIVLAPEGGALQRTIRPFRAGLGFVLGNGQNWVSWIHIADVVRMICDAVEKPEYTGIINAVSPQPARQIELARGMNQALGRKMLWRLPGAPLKVVLGDMSELMLGGARVTPEKALAAGFKFQFESLESALRDVIGPGSRAG